MTVENYAAALLITIAIAITILGSCCSRDSSEVHSTVERFITALNEGDRATIALIAPGVSSDTKLEQVLSGMAGFDSWSITEVECRSGRAQARVTFFANGQETEVVVPLSRINGIWIVDNRIILTTELDFVPLKQ